MSAAISSLQICQTFCPVPVGQHDGPFGVCWHAGGQEGIGNQERHKQGQLGSRSMEMPYLIVHTISVRVCCHFIWNAGQLWDVYLQTQAEPLSRVCWGCLSGPRGLDTLLSAMPCRAAAVPFLQFHPALYSSLLTCDMAAAVKHVQVTKCECMPASCAFMTFDALSLGLASHMRCLLIQCCIMQGTQQQQVSGNKPRATSSSSPASPGSNTAHRGLLLQVHHPALGQAHELMNRPSLERLCSRGGSWTHR